MNLKKGLLALYKKVCTSLPPDVEQAMRIAAKTEDDPVTRDKLEAILGSVVRSRSESKPMCVDLGTPVFYVSAPAGIVHTQLKATIAEATSDAASKGLLPALPSDLATGALASPSEEAGFPVVYIDETADSKLTIEMLLLGGSTEGLGRTFTLPDTTLGLGRDMDGLAGCVMATVESASGKGCPPYIIGVGVAPTRDRASWLAKQQFRRKLSDPNPSKTLASLEASLLERINTKAGRTLAIGVQIGTHALPPEACFVDVALMCWNTRRGKLIW